MELKAPETATQAGDARSLLFLIVKNIALDYYSFTQVELRIIPATILILA